MSIKASRITSTLNNLPLQIKSTTPITNKKSQKKRSITQPVFGQIGLQPHETTYYNPRINSNEIDDVEEIYLDEIIDDLCNIVEAKLGRTMGFHPKVKAQDEIDFKIGKRAKVLYDALLHSENPSYEIIETAIRFLASIEFIEDLHAIAKKRTSPEIGFRQSPPSKEDLFFGKKAHKLAIEFIENPSDEIIEEVDEFIGENGIIEQLELISDEKLNKTELGFERQEQVSKEDKQVGEKAKFIADVIKVNPSEQNLLIAFKFIQTVKQLNLMQDAVEGAERKNRCMGYHCDIGEETYSLAA